MNQDNYHIVKTIAQTAIEEMQTYLLSCKSEEWKPETKLDGSIVTPLEIHLDEIVSALVVEMGLAVVSEEGKEDKTTLTSGNYVLIDINDGSANLDYCVQQAFQHGDINTYFTHDLENRYYDHGLLVTIIKDGQPQYAAVLNYRTGECLFLDGIERKYHQEFFPMPDQIKPKGILDPTITQLPDKHIYYNKSTAGSHPLVVEFEKREKINSEKYQRIVQGAIGFRGLLVQLSNSASSFTIGRNTSIWDVGPACVAAKISGGIVLDLNGKPITFTQYFQLPGNGVIIYRENEPGWITDFLKNER